LLFVHNVSLYADSSQVKVINKSKVKGVAFNGLGNAFNTATGDTVLYWSDYYGKNAPDAGDVHWVVMDRSGKFITKIQSVAATLHDPEHFPFQYGYAVAYNAVTGNYILAYELNGSISALFLDSHGTAIGKEFTIVSSSSSDNPAAGT